MLSRERPHTPAFLPAPLPSLSDALARRAAVFGPFYIDKMPTAPRGRRETLSAQCSAYVSIADVDSSGGGLSPVILRRDGPGDHDRVLRQHHLRGALSRSLAALALVAALARHLRLPGSS